MSNLKIGYSLFERASFARSVGEIGVWSNNVRIFTLSVLIRSLFGDSDGRTGSWRV